MKNKTNWTLFLLHAFLGTSKKIHHKIENLLVQMHYAQPTSTKQRMFWSKCVLVTCSRSCSPSWDHWDKAILFICMPFSIIVLFQKIKNNLYLFWYDLSKTGKKRISLWLKKSNQITWHRVKIIMLWDKDIPLEISGTNEPSITGWKRRNYSQQNELSMQYRVL